MYCILVFHLQPCRYRYICLHERPTEPNRQVYKYIGRRSAHIVFNRLMLKIDLSAIETKSVPKILLINLKNFLQRISVVT